MLLVALIECCLALRAYWENSSTLGGLLIDSSAAGCPLFKGAGSGPSRGDIPEPLRQGETDPAPAPPRAHC